MDKKRAIIKIKGTVQGVGFRYTTKDMAKELGLTGIVRNEQDGNVYTEVEGAKDKIEVFLAWCRNGPEWAEVKNIDYELYDDLKGFKEFEIEK